MHLAAIDQIMSGLAHGCRNALQRSRACLELLELQLEDNGQGVELIHYTQQALCDLQELYEQVRSYAAPLTLRIAPTDLRKIIVDVWGIVCGREANRNVRLHILDACGTMTIPCDPARMEQVVFNVLENAQTVAPAGSEIRVTSEPAELDGKRALAVRIRDSGAGMNREQLARIFEPLYTTKTRASGLGMAVARRIVEAHGGEIRAESVLGQGTEIVFTLPDISVDAPVRSCLPSDAAQEQSEE